MNRYSPPSSIPTRSAPESSSQLVLRIASTHHQGQLIHLESEKCTIGSSPDCVLSLRSRYVHPLQCLIVHGQAGSMIRAYTADTRLNGRALQDAWLRKGDRISIGPIDLDVVELAEQIQEVQNLIESLENQSDELPIPAAPQSEVSAATTSPAADNPTAESNKTDTASAEAKSKTESNSEPERAKRLMKSLRILRKNRRAEEQAKSEIPSIATEVLPTSELPEISLETIPSSVVAPVAAPLEEIPSPSQIELPTTFASLDLQQLQAEDSVRASLLPEPPTFEPETLKETSAIQVADEISLVEVAQVTSFPSSTPEQTSFSPPTEPEPWGLKLVAEIINSEREIPSKPTMISVEQVENKSGSETLPLISTFAPPVDPTVGFHATDLRSFDTTPNYDVPKYDVPRFDVPKFDAPKFDVANYGAPTYEVASNFSFPVFEDLKLVEKSNEVSLASSVSEQESVPEPTTPIPNPIPPVPAFVGALDANVPFTDRKPDPVEPNTTLAIESFAPPVETATHVASSAELDLSSLYERAMQPVSASTFGSHSQAASNESANQIGSEAPPVSGGWNLALLSASPETPAQTDQISDIYSAAINQLNSPSVPAESPDIAAAVESSTTSISSLLDSFTNSVESTNSTQSVESPIPTEATGDQEVDRLRASLASLFEGLETRAIPPAESVPATDSSSESLGPTLNLQEPTLQLESTLPEASSHSSSHQQVEPPPALNSAPPSRPEPTKPAASVGASESNEDDSVESYMARLLARVSGRNESSAPAAPVQPSQPVATPRPTANPESVLRETFKQELAEREQEFKKPDYVPRVAAEAGIGLDKLREIANSSARSAVKVSQKKKSADSFMMSLTAAIICVIVGFILMKMSTGVSDPAFMGSLAAFAGGAFCGSRAMPKKKPAAKK